MTDTPDTEVDLAAGDPEQPAPDEVEGPAEERRQLHDVWVSGTEERFPFSKATDEGAQEFLPRDEDPALDVQEGIVVDDDYVEAPVVIEDERQIINMGPQHPSTH